ncbi:MAG: glycoside hydrolase family 3 protein [Elusimicrobia bacterium]|nr:glycoside hydrolase family 3 protein [Elusimicrobiota bacterium]
MTSLSAGGRFLVMGVPETLDSAARRAIREMQPGGFILFGRNIGLPPIPDAEGRTGEPGKARDLRALLDELRTLVEHEPVVCIDQEGGRVSRLRGLAGGAEPPTARSLAETGDAAAIRRHGRLTGRLLRLFGINLDLCPVLDVAYDHSADNSVQNRCWGETPEEVARNAASFNRALRAEGVLSCGKHFPGYSRASVDPHIELPVIREPRAVFEKDWLPYRRLIKDVDFIMTAIGLYPTLDSSGLPGTVSERILSILREELGFAGWVITDDLDMGALTRHVGLEEAVQRAVSAGTDHVLICHDLARMTLAAEAIARLPVSVLKAGRRRLEKLERRLPKTGRFSMKAFDEINDAIRKLREEVLGPGAPAFTPGRSKISPVEAALLSPVNTVGDRTSGAPAEYRLPARTSATPKGPTPC